MRLQTKILTGGRAHNTLEEIKRRNRKWRYNQMEPKPVLKLANNYFESKKNNRLKTVGNFYK